MSPRSRRPSLEYALLPRSSTDESKGPYVTEERYYPRYSASWFKKWSRTLALAFVLRLKHIYKSPASAPLESAWRRRRCTPRIILWALFLSVHLVLALVLFDAVFLPSYTHRPLHYEQLQRAALETSSPGRANPHNESVFIAASIYERNATLSSGAWADAVLELVDLLGPQNVFLSLYENDPDKQSQQALLDLERKVKSNHSINHEKLSLDGLPRITLPSGEKRLKRIAFLAEVRNRALLPLQKSNVTFDKLLFINDVLFNPIEAAQLLFSTNVDSTGRANYGAACAVDFINPFKFYDRFATRDFDGYSTGIPFYPWFATAGSQVSRLDVLAGKDAVRVRSCWGGMTAFEAKWFQKQNAPSISVNATMPTSEPLRFRSESELYWDASECCLINADLQYRRSGVGMPEDSGIYMNPFIRVAYDSNTLSWLALSRRPERLYSIVQGILSRMVGFPFFNPRRTEEPGETYVDKAWTHGGPSAANPFDASKFGVNGSYPAVERIAVPGGFCGGRKLLLINEDPQEGEGPWVNLPIPSPLP